MTLSYILCTEHDLVAHVVLNEAPASVGKSLLPFLRLLKCSPGSKEVIFYFTGKLLSCRNL